MGHRPDFGSTPSKAPEARPTHRVRWAGVAILAGLIALSFVANLWLGSGYSPAGAAADYIDAVGRNDAGAIAAALQIQPPSQVGFGSPPVHVISQRAVAAMLSIEANRHQVRTNVHTVSIATQGSTAAVTVDFAEGGRPGHQTLHLVQDPSARRLLFYPVWKVVVTPATVRVQAPASNVSVNVDSVPVAVSADAATQVLVLPGRHRIEFPATGPYAGEVMQVDAGASGVATASFHLSLSPGAVQQIGAVVKSAFTACASSSNASPLGCPQTDFVGFSQGSRWQVVGDPVADITATVADTGDIKAQGHYVMTETATDAAGLTRHGISSGPYQATVKWSGSSLTVSSIASGAGVAPAARPSGVSDDAVVAAVRSAFQACAAITSASSPDCPQSASSFGAATNVKWSLKGDPTSGAVVSFDPNAAIFTVKGSYSMHLTYDDPILGHVDQDRSGSYVARVVADGTAADCIYIGPQ